MQKLFSAMLVIFGVGGLMLAWHASKCGYFETKIGWTVYADRHPRYFKFSLWLGCGISAGLLVWGVLGLA